MKNIDTPILDMLLADEVFCSVRKCDVSRLIPFINERIVTGGEMLVENGQSADHVFFISTGRYEIVAPDGRAVKRRSGFLASEAALGAIIYQNSTRVVESGRVISIPAEELSRIANFNSHLKTRLFESFSKEDVPKERMLSAPVADMEFEHSEIKLGKWHELIGWTAMIICPYLTAVLGAQCGLSFDAAYFLAVISATAILWVFNLVPSFVPPLFSVLAVIIFDIAPSQVALSGFTSGTFFMCLSVFGIGAMVLHSGLAFRLTLKLMLWLPPSRMWYNLMFCAVGVLMTLVVPSPAGRMAMVSPILMRLFESTAGHKQRKLIVTQFFCSATTGIILVATIFMAGKPANLILYGMLDNQTQFAFQALPWLISASFGGVVLLILYAVALLWIFPEKTPFHISRQVAASQLKLLGPMQYREWGAAAAVAMLVAGMWAVPLHKLEIPWLTLSIVITLLMTGIMGRGEFRNHIDWSLLMYIGAIIAWTPIMQSIGLTDIIAGRLSLLGRLAELHLPLFIGFLCVSIVVVRFMLPTSITVVLFAAATFPIANSTGINPWVFSFVILLMSESYIFVHQHPFLMQLKNEMIYRNLSDFCDEKRIARFNLLMIAVRVAAIYLSYYFFWEYLDVL